MRLTYLMLLSLALPLAFCGLVWADESDLVWSTFLGGSASEWGYCIDVAADGAVYVVGTTNSSDFPTTMGAFSIGAIGDDDIFVAKLHTTMGALDYATYLGGTSDDGGWPDMDIAVDETSNIYVTGWTKSKDFPITEGTLDTTCIGYDGFCFDAFVVKLDPTGSFLIYSTYLGGHYEDRGRGVGVDNNGCAHVVGATYSSDFPTTANALDSTNTWCDGFLVKINPTGSAFEYSTFIGGDGWDEAWDVAIDETGHAYVTGTGTGTSFPTTPGAYDTTYHGGYYGYGGDVFVSKFDPTGSAFQYSTFLGGREGDIGFAIAIDDLGNAYVTGYTYSDDFPTTPGAFDSIYGSHGHTDGFLAKLNAVGSTLEYSTFLGGIYSDDGWGIAVHDSGQAYITGYTSSADFPITDGAFDLILNSRDAYVIKLDTERGTLDYATFLGGSGYEYGHDISVDDHGYVYVTGVTSSSDFPTTFGAFDTTYSSSEAYVAKFNLGRTKPFFELPKASRLSQNYPNPFNLGTDILYQLSRDSHVSMEVFNILGQRVRTLVNTNQVAGEYITSWNGRDDSDRNASSGIYFCRLKAGDFSKTIKMILVK